MLGDEAGRDAFMADSVMDEVPDAAYTGALENRVSLAYDVNSSTLLSQEEVLSGTEDIDLTELLTKMTQQQMAYQTVLKSSSMIMNLGLMNYL